MAKLLTEQQVLKKLGICDFRHLTKDKVVSLVSKSMIDKLDPEVAKKIIEQFPNFSETMKDILHDYKEWMNSVLLSNENSVNSFYNSCDNIINSLQKELEKDVLTVEEKKYVFEKMIEVAKIKKEKDSENKKFLVAMGTLVAVAFGVVATHLSSALGGNTEIEKEDEDEDKETKNDDDFN